MSLRIDTQNIVTTIISVHGQQENDLFEEKTKFYDDVVVEILTAYTRGPYVLVVGDFKAKPKSNLQNVSQNGKLLEHVIKTLIWKLKTQFLYVKVSGRESEQVKDQS